MDYGVDLFIATAKKYDFKIPDSINIITTKFKTHDEVEIRPFSWVENNCELIKKRGIPYYKVGHILIKESVLKEYCGSRGIVRCILTESQEPLYVIKYDELWRASYNHIRDFYAMEFPTWPEFILDKKHRVYDHSQIDRDLEKRQSKINELVESHKKTGSLTRVNLVDYILIHVLN